MNLKINLRGLLAAALVWGGIATSAIAESSSAPDAHLMRMAEFLGRAGMFSTTIQAGFDVVQASGQKIEFRERRQVTVIRPNRFRVEIEESDGEKGLVLYDGQALTAYSETQNVYASVEKPGTTDEALVYFLRDLKMRMPLALMFSTTFLQEMERRVQSVELVEVDVTTDIACLHLAVRADQVDFQVWIPETGDPLPRRIVITYRGEKGQPQFRADFSNWNLAPQLSDSDFKFTPPDAAERIEFLSEIRTPPVSEGSGGGG